MDVKDLQSEATLGERNNDGSKYASSGVTLPYNRNKPYQDVNPVPLGKVDASPARPCAVIGPDRVLPQTVSSDTIKKSAYEAWCADNVYRHPPEYPHKMTNYHTPTRNISPRQTFQENMQRIMVPPLYSSLKGNEEHNFPTDKNVSMPKNTKPNIPLETKYCEVPYSGNPINNEQKSVRNSEVSVSNMNPVLTRSAPQGWPPHARPSRPYGASELYQYPEYTNYAGSRPVPMTRPHRTAHEDMSHAYPDPYCHDVRFKPYTTFKERYPQTRYELIGNYSNPFHPSSAFPSPKYDVQKPIPQPYAYQQVPLKYLDSRIPDTVIDGYQRPTQQGNYNLPFHNQMMHPAYGHILGNCIQNKFPCPPEGSVKPVPPNKLPYETNKMYAEYENARSKAFPISENYYFNEMQRPPHHVKSQVLPNYANMHGIPSHPYYRKDSSTLKNYEYMPHFRNLDPTMLSQSRIPAQFSASGITISPSDTNLNLEPTQIAHSQEDYGYISQSPTASMRNIDFAMNRNSNEFYRRYDSRYGVPIRPPPAMANSEQNANEKEKKDIDVRQFLQMWNEVDDENATKDIAQFPNDVNKTTKPHDTVKNQDQLYVLGLVNVPREELGKYEHIQKVSKLPENIKGYNSIELLNQFEEVIESTNVNNYKSTTTKDINYQMSMKNSQVHHSLRLLPRPVSPLDVEAKISQSVIHKEVGCNFEIKPCSPKMLNVEAATPVQNLLGERAIEKVSNPLIVTPPILHGEDKLNCNILNHQEQRKSPNENVKNTSCKMVNTQFNSTDTDPNYSLQDLESNSGVCLASLPRLDNDIELNFPEVNQQFINANKGESVITATKDLPSLSLEHNIEHEHSTNVDNIHPKHINTNYEFPLNDPEREFSKLSKYRKIKKCGPESVEKGNLPFSIHNIRTDSVIIKNPENQKIYEQNKDVVAMESTLIYKKDIPKNNNFIDKLDSSKDLENKLHSSEIATQMDIAIDFSLNKNDNNNQRSIGDYIKNQSLNSPNIDLSKINNPTNLTDTLQKDCSNSPKNNSTNCIDMLQNDCSNSLKKQNKENNSKSKLQFCEIDTVTNVKIANENELQNDHDSDTAESVNSDITSPQSSKLSEYNGHKNIDELKILEKSASNTSNCNNKEIFEKILQQENGFITKDEVNKEKTNMHSEKNPNSDNIDTVHRNIEIKLNKELEEDHLNLPDFNEENTVTDPQHVQKGDKENKNKLLSEECGENVADATSENKMDKIQEEIDTDQYWETDNLGKSDTNNHGSTLYSCAVNKTSKTQNILEKVICEQKEISSESNDIYDSDIMKLKSYETFSIENATQVSINSYEKENSKDEGVNVVKENGNASEILYRDSGFSEPTSMTDSESLTENSQDSYNTPINANDVSNLSQSSFENLIETQNKITNPTFNISEIQSNQSSLLVENLQNEENDSKNNINSEKDFYKAPPSKLNVPNSNINKLENSNHNAFTTIDNLSNNPFVKNVIIESSITSMENNVIGENIIHDRHHKEPKFLDVVTSENVDHRSSDDLGLSVSRSLLMCNDVKTVSENSICKEIINCKENFTSCRLKKELFSPFIRKLMSYNEGPINPPIIEISIKTRTSALNNYSQTFEWIKLGDQTVSGIDSETLIENTFDENVNFEHAGIIFSDSTCKDINIDPDTDFFTTNKSSLFLENSVQIMAETSDSLKNRNTSLKTDTSSRTKPSPKENFNTTEEHSNKSKSFPNINTTDKYLNNCTSIQNINTMDTHSNECTTIQIRNTTDEHSNQCKTIQNINTPDGYSNECTPIQNINTIDEHSNEYETIKNIITPDVHSNECQPIQNINTPDEHSNECTSIQNRNITDEHSNECKTIQNINTTDEHSNECETIQNINTPDEHLNECKPIQNINTPDEHSNECTSIQNRNTTDEHSNECKTIKNIITPDEHSNEYQPIQNINTPDEHSNECTSIQNRNTTDEHSNECKTIQNINTTDEHSNECETIQNISKPDEHSNECTSIQNINKPDEHSNGCTSIQNRNTTDEHSNECKTIQNRNTTDEHSNECKTIQNINTTNEHSNECKTIQNINTPDEHSNECKPIQNINKPDEHSNEYKPIQNINKPDEHSNECTSIQNRNTADEHSNKCKTIQNINTTDGHSKECTSIQNINATNKRLNESTLLAKGLVITEMTNLSPLPDKSLSNNIASVSEKDKCNDNTCHAVAEDQEGTDVTTDQALTMEMPPDNGDFIRINDINVECSSNIDLHDPSDKNFKNKLIQIFNKPNLKRSLSDSALDSFNDSSDAFYSGWRPKRAKKFCSILEPDMIFEPNSQNNRRKSISSIYNDNNVSFCILIDNNCIIAEEEENDEQDGICFTEISEDCLTDAQESVNEYDNILKCSDECNQEYSETQEIEDSWVDDVGCMETVVSDDVAEDITISASSSPERMHSPENEESGIFLNCDHTDKVKHIYGDKMCNDDIMFLETLYRTPQMDVNKIINRESQISDDCIQYYNKDSLEKVLSESNNENFNDDWENLASVANSHNPLDDVQGKNKPSEENLGTVDILASDQFFSICDTYDKNENNEFHNESILTSPHKTQDDTVHSCESTIDNVFSYGHSDEYTTCTSSTSPEVSSTTSEERNSSILLKITNLKGSRMSQVNDFEQAPRTVSCKFTEINDYSTSQNFKSHRPLITKAAQKYIPPLEETLGDLKIRLPLPQHSLLRLKQLKLLKDEPKSHKCFTKSKPDIPKKPRPKFEDVLKSIDEIQIKMHKEKSKKTKKSIPKVVIKKNENGSHYASTANREPFNPDLTGRKWQPWVFLEKSHFIDKMALKNKKKAIYNHRKNTYVLAEKFRKYKSIGNAKFVISQPNLHNSSIGHLKCTIRLKHTY